MVILLRLVVVALTSWLLLEVPRSGPTVVYSYPIGRPGGTLGDGFYVRHGYATENTWYLPGYWHAGEDWYALAGDTAQTTTLWSELPNTVGRRALQELRLQPGSRYQLLATHVGPVDSRGTGASTYVVWYHIQLQSGKHGWVQAARASKAETGADGQPSTIHFNFYPAIHARD